MYTIFHNILETRISSLGYFFKWEMIKMNNILYSFVKIILVLFY